MPKKKSLPLIELMASTASCNSWSVWSPGRIPIWKDFEKRGPKCSRIWKRLPGVEWRTLLSLQHFKLPIEIVILHLDLMKLRGDKLSFWEVLKPVFLADGGKGQWWRESKEKGLLWYALQHAGELWRWNRAYLLLHLCSFLFSSHCPLGLLQKLLLKQGFLLL